jgi:hypothetical protein
MEARQLVYLDDEELKPLLVQDERIRISITIPVQQEVDKRDENRIRLKNQVQAAEEALSMLDFRRPDITRLLKPAEELVKGGRFLDNDFPGLVIYLADDFSQAYQIPFAPREATHIETHFLIKPIIPLRRVKLYYILVLGQQSIRLLQASEYSVERVALNNSVPDSLNEALHWDDPERQLQWHTGTGSEEGGRAAIFHGHGVATKETHKTNLHRYFQLLDQAISNLLADKAEPLLLAGVDYLLPIYRDASTSEHILDENITGNLEHLSDTAIQKQAWPIVQNHFKAKQERAKLKYHELAAKDMGSDELKTVVRTAYQGRVDTLFVDVNAQEWGGFDPDLGQVTRNSQRQPNDTELTNLATIFTVLRDGDVYANQHEAMPTDEVVAAIWRF